MPTIAKTAFEARITNNEFDDLCNVTGRFQTGAADDSCPAGLLCIRKGQLPNAGYTGVFNENAWYMNAAGADVDAGDVVYASNTYDWNLLQDPATGNMFAVGLNTLGLPIPAGRNGTFTKINFDGQSVYRFGEGNLSTERGVNTFFTIANGLLVPTGSAPSTVGAIYFEFRGEGSFIEGTRNAFGYVDVVACKVASAG